VGQQQLLLIVMGVIVVGIMVAVGINLFTANAIEQKREEILNECTILASEAQLYYRKPKLLGGGGNSFVGWTIPKEYTSTVAGNFVNTSIVQELVIITGTGNELVTDTDSVQIQMHVTRDSLQAIIIN